MLGLIAWRFRLASTVTVAAGFCASASALHRMAAENGTRRMRYRWHRRVSARRVSIPRMANSLVRSLTEARSPLRYPGFIRHRVLILGGGFGGLYAARAL